MSGIASLGVNAAGGAPTSVSSLDGEIGPGGMSGVPRLRGEVIRLGGVGDGRMGGRIMAEWRRVNGRLALALRVKLKFAAKLGTEAEVEVGKIDVEV